MTQVELLYDLLRQNGSFTGMEAIEAGVMNYKGRVADLRELGVPIETVYETTKNRFGRTVKYARYVYRG